MRKTNISLLIQLLGFVVLSIPAFSYGATVRYNISINPNNPEIASVSVNTSAIGQFSFIRPRAAPSSNFAQAPEVECLDDSNQQYQADYGTDIVCEEIKWAISFDRLGKLGANVSEQRNLYSPNGWWVLFEWGNIPRLKGVFDIEVCIPL